MIKLDEMEKKSQQLKEDANQLLQHLKVWLSAIRMHTTMNIPIQIKCDLDVYVERANTFAVQIKSIYMANMTHSKCNVQ